MKQVTLGGKVIIHSHLSRQVLLNGKTVDGERIELDFKKGAAAVIEAYSMASTKK